MSVIRRFLLLIMLIGICSVNALADNVDAVTVTAELYGVPSSLKQGLLDALSVNVVDPKTPLADQIAYIKRSYPLGVTELIRALKADGYTHAKVMPQSLTQHGNDWVARYAVTLGPETTLQTIDVDIVGPGKGNTVLEKLKKDSGLVVGQRYRHHLYMLFKEQLLQKAIDQGYHDAHYTISEVRINVQKHVATVHLTLVTGQQYQVGQIVVHQDPFILSEDFIFRYIVLRTKSPYLAQTLQTTQTNLTRSGYFESVSIVPTNDTKTKVTRFDIHLHAKKPQQYTLGLGYGTDTKIRGLLGWKFRYLTESGQHFESSIQLSREETVFNANYIIPTGNPLTDHYSIHASRGHVDVEPYSTTDTYVGAGLTRQYRYWLTEFGGNFYESDFRDSAGLEAIVHYLMPYLTLTYQNQQHMTYWSSGVLLSDQIQTAVKAFSLSDATFVKNTANFRWSWSATPRFRLYSRVTFGQLFVNNFHELSPTVRFYAGGIDSVRGYAPKSLGPRSNSGAQLGGKYVLTGSINAEHHLYDRFSGIIFLDMGNAFDRFESINPAKGVGLGVSVNTAVGAVRFFVSRPLSRDLTGVRIDFSIGAFL